MSVAVRWVFIAILLLACATEGAEACMRGGISTRGVVAIAALCVVFSPVIAVGAIGYGAVVGTAAAASAVHDKVETHRQQRASNLFLKRRNQLVRKVGSERFQRYLQDVHQKILQDPRNGRLLVEFGAAMLMNHDLITGQEALQRGIRLLSENDAANRSLEDAYIIATAHYTLGFTEQMMSHYSAAHNCFCAALDAIINKPAWETPPSADAAGGEGQIAKVYVTKAELFNAIGFVLYLNTRYSCEDIATRRELAVASADETVDDRELCMHFAQRAIDADPSQGMYYHNLALMKYFHGVDVAQSELNQVGFAHYRTHSTSEDEVNRLRRAKVDFEEAIRLWDTAIASGTFGTEAEGHAWKAQALAILRRTDEARAEQQLAKDKSIEVIIVDLTDWDELAMPWPLPIENYRSSIVQHKFEQKTFLKPTWCDSCMKRIAFRENRGHCQECSACKMKVCGSCHGKVGTLYCVAGGRLEFRENDTVRCDVLSATKVFRIVSVSGGDAAGLSRATCELEDTDGTGQRYTNVFTGLLAPAAVDAETSSGAPVVHPSDHVHTLKARNNHRPRHCFKCDKFIFSMRSYRCDKCPYTCHDDCVATDGSVLVVEPWPAK